MKINIKKILFFLPNLLWTLPFLAFCIGYISLQLFLGDTTIKAPHLIGKNILQATQISSQLKLNLRIIAEKDATDAQPGTIIKQHPLADSSIKSHQSIFITITKQPDPVKAPLFIGKNQKEIDALCKQKSIKNRLYYLPGNYPTGQCFAQIPAAEKILDDKKMNCYISSPSYNQVLLPDFTNKKADEVIQFLQSYKILYDVYHKNQKLNSSLPKNAIITYQKPLAGTIITPNENLYVQLQI